LSTKREVKILKSNYEFRWGKFYQYSCKASISDLFSKRPYLFPVWTEEGVLFRLSKQGTFTSPFPLDDPWIFGFPENIEKVKQQITLGKDMGTGLIYNSRPKEQWEGMSFRHSSEVAIAKELDRRNVAFSASFPIRFGGKTREIDFLVFFNGRVGVLELDGSSHQGRFDADLKRRRELMRALGVAIFEHYSSLESPDQIVNDLIKHSVFLLLRLKEYSLAQNDVIIDTKSCIKSSLRSSAKLTTSISLLILFNSTLI